MRTVSTGRTSDPVPTTVVRRHAGREIVGGFAVLVPLARRDLARDGPEV
jgi:hypothetical protein